MADELEALAGGTPAPEATPAPEPEPDLDLSEDATPEDDAELEIGARRVKVPKDVKEAWDGLQRKVQTSVEEYAGKEKTLAEREKQASDAVAFTQRHIDEISEIRSIDRDFAAYAKLTPADWMAWGNQDLESAQKAQLAFNAASAKRATLVSAVTQREGEFQQKTTFMRTQQEASFQREIANRVKDWSPQKQAALSKVAESVGFSPQELAGVSLDPRVMQILDMAAKYQTALAKAKAKPAGEPPPEPVATVRANSGAKATLRDNEPMEDWAKKFARERSQHTRRG